MSIHFFESEIDMPIKMVVLPVRSTVVATSRGVIISPINFTEEQFTKINALGTVTDIVAPSLWHHLYVSKVAARYKNARLWGPEGISEKRPDNEVLFFDKSTRSLIATDLVFNLLRPKGWAAALILGLAGTYKKLGISKIFIGVIKDRNAFSASAKKLFDWDFEQIVMSHGDIVVADGKSKLKDAFKMRGFNF